MGEADDNSENGTVRQRLSEADDEKYGIRGLSRIQAFQLIILGTNNDSNSQQSKILS